MRVWTIKEGEPLPLPECKGRLMRCGLISNTLADAGHSVIWWTSTFFHQTKSLLRNGGCTIKVSDTLCIKMLHSSIQYEKNVSLSRILYSYLLARRFKKEAHSEPKPDVIYCSFPLIDLSYEVVKFAKKNSIPVVVDVRDLWPDIIYERKKGPIRYLLKIATFFMNRKVKKLLNLADSVTATVEYDLKWAVDKGQRQNQNNQVFYMGYPRPSFSSDECKKARNYVDDLGINNDDFIIFYSGNLSNSTIDYQTIIDAASFFSNYKKNIKIVICGDGEHFPVLVKEAKRTKNIILTGYVSQSIIVEIMKRSSVGILPYFDSWDFKEAIPNKAIEYLFGGLPVLCELSGRFATILKDNNCGQYYKDSKELITHIINYIDNHEILLAEKKNAVELYMKQFDADVIYHDYLIYLLNLCKDRGEYEQ